MRPFMILLGVILMSASGYSDTWYVPDDYGTIQEAIDEVLDGDTIIVKPGTYVENIDLLGKAITIRSELGPNVTIINGNAAGSVVTFANGEPPSTVLHGFTITNGRANIGGGIYCVDASPTLKHNKIIGNIADLYAGQIFSGGGFYGENSPATLFRNIISDNTAVATLDTYYTRGGGVCFMNTQNFTMTSNIITNNLLTGPIIFGGEGAGVYLKNSSGTLVNNLIADNVLNLDGAYAAGLLIDNSTASIINNTIAHNIFATAHFSGGQQVHIRGQSIVDIANTIIWQNPSDYWPLGYDGTLTMNYTDLFKGSQGSLYPVWHSGTGNIDSDPLFVGPANGDFHLTFPSPCKDTGDNTAVTELTDFEGDPRIAYGTVDMGADEFYTHLYVTGDKTPGGLIQGKFVGLPGTTPVGLFVGSGILPSPMPTMWGEYWLQSPWILLGPLGAIPSDGVMVLPTTLPPGMTAPVDIPMQALIGLNADSLTNLCVLEVR